MQTEPAVSSGTSFADAPLRSFLASLGAKAPTPGGGASAGAVAAIAAATGRMVVAYSVGKKSLAEHEPALAEALGKLDRASALALRLAQEDAAAYGMVRSLSALPAGHARRKAELPAAQRAAFNVPCATAALCFDLLRLFGSLCPITNPWLHSDLGIAAVLAEAAAQSSRWNVLVNLGGLDGALRQEAEAALQELDAGLEAAIDRLAEIQRACVESCVLPE